MLSSGMVASWRNVAPSSHAAGLAGVPVFWGSAVKLAVGVDGRAGFVPGPAWVRITSTVRAANVAGPGGCAVGWVGKLQPASKMSMVWIIGRKKVLLFIIPKLSLYNL